MYVTRAIRILQNQAVKHDKAPYALILGSLSS